MPSNSVTDAATIGQYAALCVKLAKSFARNGIVEFDDLEQEARIALLRAAAHWRNDGPATFLSYAYLCITGHLVNVVRVERRRGLTTHLGGAAIRNPMRLVGGPISMDAVTETGRSLHDVLAHGASQEDTFADSEEVEGLRRAVDTLNETLTTGERTILRLTIDGDSASEIGRAVGIATWTAQIAVRSLLSRLRALLRPEAAGTRVARWQLTGITYNGRTQTISAWARELGVQVSTLHRRLTKYRWPVERALGEPTYESRSITFDGRTLSVAEWARELGHERATIHNRLRRGWPVERALTRKAA